MKTNKLKTPQDFVEAIIAILKEKNTLSVSFDPKSYEDKLSKSELPWCVRFDSLVDTISIRPDNDSLRGKIIISVVNGGQTIYDTFDGNENEDFEKLFYKVYDALRDGTEEEEADLWIGRFLTARFRAKNDAVVDGAKNLIILRIKDIVSKCGGSVRFKNVKAVRLDKLDMDADVMIPYPFKPESLDVAARDGRVYLSYSDDRDIWVDDLVDLSLCDCQSILYSLELELY